LISINPSVRSVAWAPYTSVLATGVWLNEQGAVEAGLWEAQAGLSNWTGSAGTLGSDTYRENRVAVFDGATWGVCAHNVSAAHEVWAVTNVTADANQILCSGATATAAVIAFGAGGSVSITYGPDTLTVAGVSFLNQYCVWRFRFNGVNSSIYRNGAQLGYKTFGAVPATTGNFILGAGIAGLTPYTGVIAEVYRGVGWTNAQAVLMTKYLMNKWAVNPDGA
jgi:hypothetical protein